MKRWVIAGLAAAAAGLSLGELRARRFDLRGRVVLITGGSRGLGLVLAREYARRGAAVALIARDPEELERACRELQSRGATVLTIACDVGDERQVEAAVRRVVGRFGRLDVVVNNAGDIEVGPLETMNRDDWERSMSTNFWGALHTTLAALPHMRQQGGGRVVNISSIGGLVGLPHLVPYCASKFAVTGLSYGLRAELAKDRIFVTTVCPWLLRTGSPPNAFFKGERDAELAWFAVSDALPIVTMSAERAARRIVRASIRGDARLVLGVQAKVAAAAQAIAPRLVSASMAVVNRVLPKSQDTSHPRRGLESRRATPSWLTVLGDRAAVRNNETPVENLR
jgi:NAD(P)-dependent dehydrogenase (short-subunit alcohol dehydrogenase family)